MSNKDQSPDFGAILAVCVLVGLAICGVVYMMSQSLRLPFSTTWQLMFWVGLATAIWIGLAILAEYDPYDWKRHFSWKNTIAFYCAAIYASFIPAFNHWASTSPSAFGKSYFDVSLNEIHSVWWNTWYFQGFVFVCLFGIGIFMIVRSLDE